GALLFAASGVFTQLQMALNRIWGVTAKPGGGFRQWLRKRFLSLGLVGVLAFLAAVSLTADTVISALGLGADEEVMAQVINAGVSTVVFTLLFAAVFKLLPDVVMRWTDVFGGAFVTAVLFALSKYAIGYYLAQKGLGTTYGAAGSAVVVLAWVYFSGAVLFIGAEITQAWLKTSGRQLEPNAHAVRLRPAQEVPDKVTGQPSANDGTPAEV
ncbi:MAG: YihY/virulence factor BrkB family protein, partial [Planctomycetes bacterium]|nr:YihY/virulence factor BrkB family protein [Planctomycetota bacterium]